MKTFKRSFLALALTAAFTGRAAACAVCMGGDDSTMRNASNSTLWVLLGLVCFIFTATAATAFFLWRKANSVQLTSKD